MTSGELGKGVNGDFDIKGKYQESLSDLCKSVNMYMSN